MFLAHKSDLKINFAKPLIQFDKKKILVNNQSLMLLNNICPHQGSLILTEPTDKISCRYHGWTWDHAGRPLNSGNTEICNNFNLVKKNTYEINDLIFTDPIDLGSIKEIDFSYMTLVESRVDSVLTDYGNIIDVFLDVDHIPIVHSSIYDSIGVKNDVEWVYYDWGSIQLVHQSTDYSEEFKETLIGMPDQKLAAVWITVYPYTTIEWQPGALFINVCVPRNECTDVCVFKYRDSRYRENNWKINSEIWETAWLQDKQQAESIINRSMFDAHLETSKIHFRNWNKK